MRQPERGAWKWACIDMLSAQVATWVVVLMLVVTQMGTPQPMKSPVELQDEFTVEMTWPDGNLDDIDMHMLLPDGHMVNFRTKEVEFVILDHDDLGLNANYVDSAGVHRLIPGHKETMKIRAIVPGTYVVNVHVFRINDKWEYSGQAPQMSSPVLPYKVHVRMWKNHPYDLVVETDVLMSHVGEQRTAFSFEVLGNGFTRNVDKDTEIDFIPIKDFTGGMTPSAHPQSQYGPH